RVLQASAQAPAEDGFLVAALEALPGGFPQARVLEGFQQGKVGGGDHTGTSVASSRPTAGMIARPRPGCQEKVERDGKRSGRVQPRRTAVRGGLSGSLAIWEIPHRSRRLNRPPPGPIKENPDARPRLPAPVRLPARLPALARQGARRVPTQTRGPRGPHL